MMMMMMMMMIMGLHKFKTRIFFILNHSKNGNHYFALN